MEIYLPKKEDVKEISEFIAKLNIEPENHTSYCGEKSEEIAKSLLEDITDRPFHECFVVAKEQGGIVGVLGFDPDLERETAEVWGPFIEGNHWSISKELWEKMIKLLPDRIQSLSMFVNERNLNCINLAQELNFEKKSEEVILKIKKENLDQLEKVDLLEINHEYHQEMKELHDKVFPGTYYAGEQILANINQNRKVFICKENESLAGYIYVEVEPEFGEGSIEFFAVKKEQRGKGLGVKLINMALKWMFSFDSISEIILCVNSDNKQAMKLYGKVGFKEKHRLYYHKKVMEG